MLGSYPFFFTILFIVFVSKPYRYARKYVCSWYYQYRNVVSKPYRYARKERIEEIDTFEDLSFKTL